MYLAIACAVIMASIITFVLAFKLRTRKRHPTSVCIDSNITSIVEATPHDEEPGMADGRSACKWKLI